MKLTFSFSATVISLILTVSAAFGQQTSHFDLSGNLTYQGATLPSAPSASTDLHTFGWQTTGVTRVNRWFGIASQFGGSSTSTSSISLIGFTGPGTIHEYSMLAGPRINIPTHTRFSPYVEGLAGGDHTSTKMISSGTVVNGSQYALTYAVGGGAQIDVSRHFGLNFEGQYLRNEGSLAFTGWQPAHFQVSAGLVIHMFTGSPQIAEEHSLPTPVTSADSHPPTPTPGQNAETLAPASNTIMTVRPASTAVATQMAVQPPMIAAPPVSPAALPQAARVTAAAVLTPAVVPASVPGPAPVPQTVAAPPTPTNAAPVFAEAASQAADAQPENQSFSLGEYARRLREKKQQQKQ